MACPVKGGILNCQDGMGVSSQQIPRSSLGEHGYFKEVGLEVLNVYVWSIFLG